MYTKLNKGDMHVVVINFKVVCEFNQI